MVAEEEMNGNLHVDRGPLVNYLMMLILTLDHFHQLIIQILHAIHGEYDYPFVEVVFMRINGTGI